MNNELTGKIKKLAVQFIKFGMVGVTNSIVMLAVYYFVIWINNDLYLLGNLLGYLLGILNSYILNSKFVFKNKKNGTSGRSAVIKVYISYGITLALQTILLYIMVNKLSISDSIAPIINIVITTPINFILNKCWAFKSKENNGGKKID